MKETRHFSSLQIIVLLSLEIRRTSVIIYVRRTHAHSPLPFDSVFYTALIKTCVVAIGIKLFNVEKSQQYILSSLAGTVGGIYQYTTSFEQLLQKCVQHLKTINWDINLSLAGVQSKEKDRCEQLKDRLLAKRFDGERTG